MTEINRKKADVFEIWRNPLTSTAEFWLWSSEDKMNRMFYQFTYEELKELLKSLDDIQRPNSSAPIVTRSAF